MNRSWVVVVDNYDGLSKKGIELVVGIISGYLSYVLPVKNVAQISEKELEEHDVILLGKYGNNPFLNICEKKEYIKNPKEEEGYSIFVGKNVFNSERQMIVVSGYDEKGLMYGCVDFCNKYCGTIAYERGYLYGENYFNEPFNVEMPKWSISSAPAIKRRAIWTWGHVIYDYKKFFENMLKLRMNEVVIWNDCVPINANDVVAYAHSLGIKVIWGFAWGWTTKCESFAEMLTNEKITEIKQNILHTYESQYENVGGDGIYFQSFTELNKDTVGGKCIAEIVTELVNEVSDILLAKNPYLHIQFGLHATSVKTHLEILKKVDKRISIVWEDCGAFPYAYNPNQIENFDETLSFTEKLLTLRKKDEMFGAVMKGMLNLDWQSFRHFSDSYILGAHTYSFMQERQHKKNKAWKIVQSAWLKNAKYAQKMLSVIAQQGINPIVEVLVEDAMFENQLPFVTALFAEMLWNPNMDINETISVVASYPCVTFANI